MQVENGYVEKTMPLQFIFMFNFIYNFVYSFNIQ